MLFSDEEVCGRETGNNESRWNGLIVRIEIEYGQLVEGVHTRTAYITH